MIMARAAAPGSAISTTAPRPTRRRSRAAPASGFGGPGLRRLSPPCSPCSTSPGWRGRALRRRRRPSTPGSDASLAAVRVGGGALVAAGIGEFRARHRRRRLAGDPGGRARQRPGRLSPLSKPGRSLAAGARSHRLHRGLGARPRARRSALHRGLARVRPDDGPRGRRQPAAVRGARKRGRRLSALARLLRAGARGQPRRRRRPGLRKDAGDALRPQPAPRRIARLGRCPAAQLLFPAAADRPVSRRPRRGSGGRPDRPVRPRLRRAARGRARPGAGQPGLAQRDLRHRPERAAHLPLRRRLDRRRSRPDPGARRSGRRRLRRRGSAAGPRSRAVRSARQCAGPGAALLARPGRRCAS